MWFGVLGPLSVRHGGAMLQVPAPRQRTLLAALLVKPGQPVSFDQLADTVWDGRPPSGARATLRNYVKRLRQGLGPQAGARIRTCDPGYLIDVDAAESDLLTFARLCADGSRAVRACAWRTASDRLSAAEALWRGPALADVRSEQLKERVIPRLEQLRLQAAEGRIEAGLHLGGEEALVPELQALVAAHPWRERFHAQLMLALYRCGRQAEALAAFRDARRALVSEFGVEPGGELQRLHQRMLAADPDLMTRPASAQPASTRCAGPRGGSRRPAWRPRRRCTGARRPTSGR